MRVCVSESNQTGGAEKRKQDVKILSLQDKENQRYSRSVERLGAFFVTVVEVSVNHIMTKHTYMNMRKKKKKSTYKRRISTSLTCKKKTKQKCDKRKEKHETKNNTVLY